MEDTNLAILVDAKTEYTNQLVNFLKGRSYRCIKELFDETKADCTATNKLEDVFSLFQKELATIPKWNENRIKEEYEKMVIHSKCDWLEELLTAVFISHTRILTSIHNKNNKKPVKLVIPKPENFVHQCYIDIAREIWKSPYLFDTSISNFDFQRNRRDVENMIEKSIQETTRKQLPVKVILKQYLGDSIQDETSPEFSMEEGLSQSSKENLKQMVQQELKTLNADEATEATEENTSEIKMEITETSPTEVVEENTTSDLEGLQELAEATELEGLQELEGLDELKDVSDELESSGDVYGLLEDENIQEEVEKELNKLNTKDVKNVSLTQPDPIDPEVTVTKKGGNYTFFNDAPSTLD